LITINNPPTTFSFIDRFLVTAEAYNIPAQIIFNKKDVLDDEMLALQQEMMDLYTNIGYPCYAVSAFNSKDIDFLKTLLKDKITLISGHSGVGKSTLVNAIEAHLDLKTGDISSAHLKGMHTTTFAELFPLSFGGDIIDSPGIKELGLVEMKKEEVGHYFPEMRDLRLNCKFGSRCLHLSEPKCAIVEAVQSGAIAKSRYNSYYSMVTGEDNRK